MQTTQVSNPAHLLAAGKAGAKTAQPGAADGDSFSQALSREVGGRDAADGSAARSETRQQTDATKAPEAGAEKPVEAQADASEQEAASEVQSQFSSDMLALVAAINSITTRHEPAAEANTGSNAGAGLGRAAADALPVLDAETALATEAPADEAGIKQTSSQLTQLHAAAAATAAGANVKANEAVTDFATALHETASTSGVIHAANPQLALQASRHLPAAADKLTPSVGTPAWDQALGQKIVWMVAGEQQSASLTLNPPDLGPLQVVLNVSNSQASATFSAAQPEVRQALEAALPKLRDMLSEAGIQLGQASVDSGQPNQTGEDRRAAAHTHDSGGAMADSGSDSQARTALVQPASSGLGLVDTFA